MKGFRGIAVAGLAAAACGAGHKVVAPSPSAAVAMPSHKPFATPGERMVYDITLHGIEMATFTVAIGDVTTQSGHDVIVVQTGVQSSPLVSMLHPVNDNFTGYEDVATSAPILFHAAELADPSEDLIETSDSDAANVVDGEYGIHVWIGDQYDLNEKQKIGAAPLYDMNGFLLALRGWDAPVGTTVVAEVIRSRWIWRTQVTRVGSENLVTPLGELPAVKLEGVSRRLLRDDTDDPTSDTRHYTIWISDDADRVPLAIVAKTDYGDVRMDIAEYRAGTGKPL